MAFPSLLKAWRHARRYSQAELAERAALSQRHLSFLETGRSNPSRDMVLRLARVLAVPLRQRNQWLCAAGHAPVYAERALDDPAMAPIREALETTLAHHDPFPAFVVDRQWNIVLQNQAVVRLVALLGDPFQVWAAVDPTGGRNLVRLLLHPQGLKPLVDDWPAVARAVLLRLEADWLVNPAHAGIRRLLSEVRAWPDVQSAEANGLEPIAEVPVMSMTLRVAGQHLAFFSMICSFGTAVDLTANELRLEFLFPSDPGTARFLRQAAGDGGVDAPA